jgi:hypothetical protein
MPRRSQWPRRLRHELSSLARMLGSWVQIPLEAWMSVFLYSVFLLFCVQVATLRRTDPPSKESYRLCIGLRKWKCGQGPKKKKGCRAVDILIWDMALPFWTSSLDGGERWASRLGRLTPISSVWETGWTWDSVWTLWRSVKYFAATENRTPAV